MDNLFNKYTWSYMMNLNPQKDYDIHAYHKLLSPEIPFFLDKYLELPILQRLKGVGLLCGTDWTKLYNNRFYYSRFDHSIGVALIIWNFTHNKAQTIAGLLHDVSTPSFSHVCDFRKGDALTQTATEQLNAQIIRNDNQLQTLLQQDELSVAEVEDYHKYSVCDNEIPQLSADRLEYMFPSGMALNGTWDLQTISRCYHDITILTNEQNLPELGFKTLEVAEYYCAQFCSIGHILQLNENKLTLQLLAQVLNTAVSKGILTESDFMTLSERDILEKIEKFHREFGNVRDDGGTYRLYKTFRKMTKIEHIENPLPEEEYFNVSLDVKQRYINPLVLIDGKPFRLKNASKNSEQIINDFLAYKDTPYGAVPLIKIE